MPCTKLPAVSLSLLALLAGVLLGCDNSAGPAAATSTAISAAPTRTPTVRATVVPTAHGPSDTQKKDGGQSLVLSNAKFYWTLKLPRDWIVMDDTGFELQANNPPKSAFVHLLSQTWKRENRLPNAQAYVSYWKSLPYGSAFPVHADGQQVAQADVSPDHFGGPYLRFEFIDARHSLHYAQIYASGGGPNSMVVTTGAKNADFDGLKPALDGILTSAALLKEQ